MKVLIIDDDPEMVDVIALLLKTNKIKPLKAFSGREGLDLAVNRQPDVLLLDIMMPEMDGFQVFEELLKDDRTAGIPVIFVTAKSGDEPRAKAMSMGASAYVTKPYSRNELMEKVRQAAAGKKD